MTSGSRFERVSFIGVGWRLPWCLGLFRSLLCSLSLFPRPSIVVKLMVLGSVLGEVAWRSLCLVVMSSLVLFSSIPECSRR
jgi:hypothetical protein